MEKGQIKQLPIKVEVEMSEYLERDSVRAVRRYKKEWLIPSGFRGENLIVTENRDRQLSVHYLKKGEWQDY